MLTDVMVYIEGVPHDFGQFTDYVYSYSGCLNPEEPKSAALRLVLLKFVERAHLLQADRALRGAGRDPGAGGGFAYPRHP